MSTIHERIELNYKPGDEFTHEGRNFLWLPALARNPKYKANYHIGTASFYQWAVDGCFLLKYEKPKLYQVVYPGRRGERVYIDQDFANRYLKARKKLAPPATPDPNRISLQEALDLGFPLGFLTKYSAYKSPRKGKTKKFPGQIVEGVSHPHLRGPIKSGIYFMPSGRVVPWFWKPDLLSLLAMSVPDTMISTVEIKKLGFLPTNLMHYVKYPTHHLDGRTMTPPEYYPVMTRRGQQAFLLHFVRSEFESVSKPKVQVGYRVWTDPETGKRWVPEIELAAIAGYKRGTIFLRKGKPNPEWGGLVLDFQRQKIGVQGERKKGTLIYPEEQGHQIRRYRAGIPEPATSPLVDDATIKAEFERLHDRHTKHDLAHEEIKTEQHATHNAVETVADTLWGMASKPVSSRVMSWDELGAAIGVDYRTAQKRLKDCTTKDGIRGVVVHLENAGVYRPLIEKYLQDNPK